MPDGTVLTAQLGLALVGMFLAAYRPKRWGSIGICTAVAGQTVNGSWWLMGAISAVAIAACVVSWLGDVSDDDA